MKKSDPHNWININPVKHISVYKIENRSYREKVIEKNEINNTPSEWA